MSLVKSIARKIRILREAQISEFIGVRSLGFELSVQGVSQLSLNFTQPDLTSVDAICGWVQLEANQSFETELIGVIRECDLATSRQLKWTKEQVVEL